MLNLGRVDQDSGLNEKVSFERRYDIIGVIGRVSCQLQIARRVALTGSWEDGRRKEERSRDRVGWHEAGPR